MLEFLAILAGGGEVVADGRLAAAIKSFSNWATSPVQFSVGTIIALSLVLWRRKFFSKKWVVTVFFALGAAYFVFAWSDPDFNRIVTKPDNVPIILLFVAVIFFTWLSLRRAAINDERLRKGEPTCEGELSQEKTPAWPDLVYIEFICLILCTVLLTVWSIGIEAPLEEPAATARTPNPSKAPWYFLGLQELLVYFDPWIAGVLLPSFIIVGLMAVPYLDKNPKGNGYYTFDERPFAVSFYRFGFILFWVSLLVMGTFLRGPNWSFFGPFEYWDLYKLEPMVNVDLSTMFWVGLLDQPRPDDPWLRELPGIALILSYFVLVPPILGRTLFRGLLRNMGMVRYQVFMHLFLWFVLVPLKMGLRWTVDLKYFVSLPEFFFNI